MIEIPYMNICLYSWDIQWFNFNIIIWNPDLEMELIWTNNLWENKTVKFSELLNNLKHFKNLDTLEEINF